MLIKRIIALITIILVVIAMVLVNKKAKQMPIHKQQPAAKK
jgi:uncharacterized membrane protein